MAQAGYTGKLPAYGDFVEGGGALKARQGWSAWAERGLSAARDRSGGGFPDIFLTSPIWRFAVAGGVFGPEAAAGVFCPSMDKVGRLFPFAALAEFPAGVSPMAAATALDEWFERLETAILSALDPAATLEGLTATLTDPPRLRAGDPKPVTNGATSIAPLPVDEHGAPAIDDGFSLDLDDIGPETSDGDGVWITLGGIDAPARGYTQTGQANDSLFSVLITGEAAHGQ